MVVAALFCWDPTNNMLEQPYQSTTENLWQDLKIGGQRYSKI